MDRAVVAAGEPEVQLAQALQAKALLEVAELLVMLVLEAEANLRQERTSAREVTREQLEELEPNGQLQAVFSTPEEAAEAATTTNQPEATAAEELAEPEPVRAQPTSNRPQEQRTEAAVVVVLEREQA